MSLQVHYMATQADRKSLPTQEAHARRLAEIGAGNRAHAPRPLTRVRWSAGAMLIRVGAVMQGISRVAPAPSSSPEQAAAH